MREEELNRRYEMREEELNCRYKTREEELNRRYTTREEELNRRYETREEELNRSSPSFSSDRQLSADLVHVGRQRLDFLPMLEHSGTYRESSVHTGSFAREIISLVHLVKAGPRPGRPEARPGEEAPGASGGGHGHDIGERSGAAPPGAQQVGLHPVMTGSMPSFEYSDQDEPTQEDEEDEEDGFSNWMEDTSRRRGGHEAPRRGAPYAQRRNTRPVSRVDAERSNRSGAAGPNNNNNNNNW
ncbi:putative protein CXorf23 [Liparis tanakae]|uniref:Uncharacterized protein n=1 Tax=Liparis tanakae TaxID=230148 RepID=A0A4Z2EVH2_9TELE|nr:putative protein CXorf23 [Liparis tanakae]